MQHSAQRPAAASLLIHLTAPACFKCHTKGRASHCLRNEDRMPQAADKLTPVLETHCYRSARDTKLFLLYKHWDFSTGVTCRDRGNFHHVFVRIFIHECVLCKCMPFCLLFAVFQTLWVYILIRAGNWDLFFWQKKLNKSGGKDSGWEGKAKNYELQVLPLPNSQLIARGTVISLRPYRGNKCSRRNKQISR